MEYNGLGERVRMTGWQGAQSATTVYRLDLTRANRVLAAATGAQTTYYLYDRSKSIAEFTTAWAYGLPDVSGTPRQLTDVAGAVTLAGSYTPWGETLEQAGSGNFAWGYFGGLMDAATGLIYVGSGQYYDPATGRFLTRVNTRGPNPYVPWRGDPLGALLAPAAMASLLLRRRRGKLGQADHLLLIALLMFGLGTSLVACSQTTTTTAPSGVTPSPSGTITNTPPTTPTQQPTTLSVPPATHTQPPATQTPRLPATQTPSPTPCPPEIAAFDPINGPKFEEVAKLGWNYAEGTDRQINNKRIELAGYVLAWLKLYQGGDGWWKDPSSADGLNAFLIKAWLLEGEAGEFLGPVFDNLSLNPATLMARDKNSHLRNGLTATALAKYTYFFDPSGHLAFDQSDWDRWKRRPSGKAQDYIRTSGERNVGDPTDWWGYNEIACDYRSIYNHQVIQNPSQTYQYAYDLRRSDGEDPNGNDYYLGTSSQHVNAHAGRRVGACP